MKSYSILIRNFVLLISVSCVLLLFGCSSEKTTGEDSNGIEADSSTSVKNMQKIFYSIPSPIQAASQLKKAGVKYSPEILNPIANETKYSTSFKMAVNMGIYGTDLAYCNIFNHTQEAINYLNVVNKIGNNIGLTGIIEKAGILSRFQENIGNKDSLMMVLSDLFRESDDFMKENKQSNTASVVLAGGWVEALYIAILQSKKNSNEEIRKVIGDQKLSLASLSSMLPNKGTDKETDDFKANLADLKISFEKITTSEGESKIITDPVTKVTTVSGGDKLVISDEVLNEIAAKVIALRTNLIK